jgi:3-dehydroquinate synthetase
MKPLSYDKKFVRGVNRFVLPRRIGRVEVIEGVPVSIIKQVLKAYI